MDLAADLRKDKWNSATLAGVGLGAIATAYMFIVQFLSGIESLVMVNIVTFVLWAAKFIGCIWFMHFCMKRYDSRFDDYSFSRNFEFGIIASLCSALILSAMALANVLFFNPDLIAQQMDEVVQSLGSMLDSNTINALDKVESIMPGIIFFSNLIYCFLYGTVLSLIFARRLAAADPFGKDSNDKTF